MEKMTLNQIREAFLSFWESKKHYRLKSFSLVPQHDKSLLIINSGMAPMKAFFAGTKEPPSKRVTTCQKCIRTLDIDNVGITARHGTFFEMLGNFSFGDYFKEDAIKWSWEFSTEVIKLPEERLWVTIYENDDEAYDIWHDQVGIPDEKIVRLGKDDNFWQIGTGPCGPCSEIYYDRGEEYGCGKPDCKPGCDCDRYLEYWNLVFTQFDAKADGTYEDLVQKNIDTGLGLERMGCILQEVDSIFDVDTLRHVIDSIEERCNVKYAGDGSGEFDVPIRIVTDHIRSAMFMIGDGIMPSNEGRGYVLRRLIRRAARQGRKMGINGPFLSDIIDSMVEGYAEPYPELVDQKVFIKKILSVEEQKFNATLDQGMEIINRYISEMKADGRTVLEGEKAFKLHDTYGFPIDITSDIMSEQGLTVDEEGFEKLMDEQRAASKMDAAKDDIAWEHEGYAELEGLATEFSGYETCDDKGSVIAIYRQQLTGEGSKIRVTELGEEMSGVIALDRTPFYATSGGQLADNGIIENDEAKAVVTDVEKFGGVFLHHVTVESGTLRLGSSVECHVDKQRRHNTSRNHTATHLLHKALRMVLGEHVHQAGSRVSSDRLRFDFSHYEAMTAEQISRVEKIVNEKIDEFLPVSTEIMNLEDATATGAFGLFEEKYGDQVRVVSIGDFSKELCGGVHLRDSGEAGAFRILSESGVANGVRRIEAVTGAGLLAELNDTEDIVSEVCGLVKADRAVLPSKIRNLQNELRKAKAELAELKKADIEGISGEIISEAVDISGTNVIAKVFEGLTINELRQFSDEIKSGCSNTAMIFAAVNGQKVTFMVSLTDDVINKGYHAGKIIKEVAAAAGGGGGGKADMAQAGGKDPDKVEDALKAGCRLFEQ